MKNLFDYATKELSQDAFLRWLFENYNCENENIKRVCRTFFAEFTNDEFTKERKLNFEEISELRTQAQWKYIDVSIWFTCAGKKYLIVIEDKTISEEHNQLETYNTKIAEYLNKSNFDIEHVFKVFYKTSKISNEEKERIKRAQWKEIFDITRIYNMLKDEEKTGSEVLDYYIEYIKSLNKLFVDYKEVPINEWRKNFSIFTNYCDDIIKSYPNDHYRSRVYQGKYAETFIQKNLPNNITVELGIFFRDWGYSAWIKVWNTNLSWKEPCIQKENIIKVCSFYSRLDWENKTHKNRIKIIKKEFTDDLIYDEFNVWIENCLKDYFEFMKKIENNVEAR